MLGSVKTCPSLPNPKFTDKIEESRNVRAALAGHVARYTVGVVPETGASLGTGLLVASGNALYIATAKHVAHDLLLDKVYVIPRSDDPLKIVEEDEITRHLLQDRPIDRCRVFIEDRLVSSSDRTNSPTVPETRKVG